MSNNEAREFNKSAEIKKPKSINNDLAEDTFISRIPNWLRWVLLLPAAIIFGLLIPGLFRLLSFNYVEEGSLWYIITETFLSGATSFLFIYFGASFAPKHQFLTSIILTVILIILITLMFVVLFMYPQRSMWESGLYLVGLVVGIVIAANMIHKGTPLKELL